MTVSQIGIGTISQLNTNLLTVFKNGVTAQAVLAVGGIQSQSGIQSIISTAAGSLESAAAGINPSTASVFEERTLTSSAPSLVTGTAASGSEPQTFSVFVSQIARAQVSSSNSVSSTAASTINSGSNIIKIAQGDSTTFISASIAAGSTNNAALTAVAAAINDSAVDVAAEVVSTGSGNIKLNITSNLTGADSAFTVSDVTGNVTASQGIAVAASAQDAVFQINGGTAQTSQSNSVSVLNGNATLQFLAPTPSSISTSISTNVQGITDAVTDFADAVNRAVSALGGTGNLLTGIVKGSAGTLKSVGIDVKGQISVDQSAFKTALAADFSSVTAALSAIAAPVESAAHSIRLQAPLLSAITAQSSSQSFLLGSLLNTLA